MICLGKLCGTPTTMPSGVSFISRSRCFPPIEPGDRLLLRLENPDGGRISTIAA
jgi:hypothetical protein